MKKRKARVWYVLMYPGDKIFTSRKTRKEAVELRNNIGTKSDLLWTVTKVQEVLK